MLRQAAGDAFRVSRNTPWTSATIVLTLALGTGLNAVGAGAGLRHLLPTAALPGRP